MVSQASSAPLTFDDLPQGSLKEPLLLRTYVPDPGLANEVFAHHARASASPEYQVTKGVDGKGTYEPISGIPAAIAVSHGPVLSYVFDTTECRMLYAWQGGFLDMFPYWGDKERGNRQKFDYVPRLVGTVFSMATGSHPLIIGGQPLAADAPISFVGYDLDAGSTPTFRFMAGGHEITQRIEPIPDTPRSCRIRMAATDGTKLGYRAAAGESVRHDGETLLITISGPAISEHRGFDRDLKITKASAENGQRVFNSYGCSVCHSVDGSPGHGPTLKNVFGSKVAIEGSDTPVVADDAYIRESLAQPGARIVKGFPPNFMPAYPLKPIEIDSLVRYIESLSNPSPQ